MLFHLLSSLSIDCNEGCDEPSEALVRCEVAGGLGAQLLRFVRPAEEQGA